jgi:hypothetical protein
MLRKLLVFLVFGLAAGVAAAHGTPPQHGGVVREASDLSFELVAKGDAATLYVHDHGKPLATAGMSGRLTVLNGKEKAEADLAPAGDNRLEARAKIEKGARVVAVLTTAQKKTLTVRFTVK